MLLLENKEHKKAMFCNCCGSGWKRTGRSGSKKSSTSTSISTCGSSGEKPRKRLLSFHTFKESKGKEWKSKVDSGKKKKRNDSALITLGLLEWKNDQLKQKRGKRFAVRVGTEDSYHMILQKCHDKWRDYFKDCYHEEVTYILTFDGGTEAVCMPGTAEPFNLNQYHLETGKDFKRIVPFLCTVSDRELSEQAMLPNPYGEEQEDYDEDELQEKKYMKHEKQVTGDERLAMELQSEFDQAVDENLPTCSTINLAYNGTKQNETQVELSLEDVVHSIKSKVDQLMQFFIVVRRCAPFQRLITLWQRECKKSLPISKLTVHYTGEEEIDTGAIKLEFLTNIIIEMRKIIFPDGAPMDSMLNVHNGCFFTCGQIVAVSLSQGRPSPRILDKSAYKLLINPHVDVTKLEKKNLTFVEQKLMNEISIDPSKHSYLIIDRWVYRNDKCWKFSTNCRHINCKHNCKTHHIFRRVQTRFGVISIVKSFRKKQSFGKFVYHRRLC